ncbi:MAG: GtrA family protein [Chloroflexota bacterium]
MAILTNARERTRFLRFAVVGIIGAVVDFGIMNLLVNQFYARLVIAGTISFIAAIISNFLWNRYWTYPDSRSRPLARQLAMFALVSVTGLVIRIPLLALLEPVFHALYEMVPFAIPFFSINFLADNTTLAIAVIVVMFWNFFANRYWTYNDVE